MWAAPASGVEIRIAEDGEVLARGANMFVGYLGQPEKTAETLDDDGWVHTGDIGVLDDDGYLKIVDRKKELIITAGGKNVSPANLEAELKMIPLVGQACAIGEQRPFMTALVVLDPDASAAWAREHGLTGDDATMAALAENPDVIAEIDAGLAEVMSGFNNAEVGQEGQGARRGVAAGLRSAHADVEAQATRHPREVRRGDRGALRQVDRAESPRVQSVSRR